MNYLAHLFLSGSNTGLLLGNFIADWVKGSDLLNYPTEIQKGIRLHRFIDSFTDTHPITLCSRNRLRPHYGKYSGIVVDVFYDHFLSVNWNLFSPENISTYISNVHDTLSLHIGLMPPMVQEVLPKLIANRRLESYGSISGMENALGIMSTYTSLPNNTQGAIMVLKEQYTELNREFLAFFPELMKGVMSYEL